GGCSAGGDAPPTTPWPTSTRPPPRPGTASRRPSLPPMFLLGRPSPDRLARILASVADAPLTYDEVGATRGAGELPPGYHHVRERRELGSGDVAFRAAADGLRTWQLHRRQGFVVVPAEPPL